MKKKLLCLLLTLAMVLGLMPQMVFAATTTTNYGLKIENGYEYVRVGDTINVQFLQPTAVSGVQSFEVGFTFNKEYFELTDISATYTDLWTESTKTTQIAEYNTGAKVYFYYTNFMADTSLTQNQVLVTATFKALKTSTGALNFELKNYSVNGDLVNYLPQDKTPASGTYNDQATVKQIAAAYTGFPTAKSGLTYNGAEQDLVNYGSVELGTVQYAVTTTNTKPTTGFATTAKKKDAGTYYVWHQVTSTYGNNMKVETSNTPVQVSIGQANVTVTATPKSKTYGEADPALEYTTSALMGSDTKATAFTGALTRVTGENVGSYDITQGTLASTNYNISFTKGTFTINKKDLTITANDKSITYGDAAPSYDVKYEGFVSGESASNLSGKLSVTSDYKQYDDAKTYTITASGYTSNNYNITYKTGTLTVNKKDITFTWSTPLTFTYDTKEHSVTATPQYVRSGDSLTLTYENNKKTDKGDYTAKVTAIGGTSAKNYNLAANTASASQAWSISAATDQAITLTMNGWTYDGTAHEPTVGVKYGESSAVTLQYKVKGAADSTYSTTKPVNAGTYTVKASTTATNNYNAASTTKDYTISKAAVELTWGASSFTYNGAAQKPTASIKSGVVSGETITVTVAGEQTDANGKTGQPAKYTATASLSGTTKDNYTISNSTQDFKIEQKSISGATINDGTVITKAFNNASQSVSKADVKSVVIGGLTVADYSVSCTDQKAASDNYTFTVTATTGTNFTGTATGTWKITKLTIADSNVTYGDDPTYTGSAVTKTVKVAFTSPAVTLTAGTDYDVTGNSETNVNTTGEYTITITGKGNYSGTVTKKWNVVPKTITEAMVTLAAKDVHYTGSATGPEVTVKDGTKTLTVNTDYTISGNTATNVGANYKLTVTGTKNYKGTVEKPWTIGYQLTGSFAQLDTTDNAIVRLYSSTASNTELRRAWTTNYSGTFKLDEAYSHEAVKGTLDTSTKTQTFTFPSIQPGDYKLVILKAGKYMPEIVDVKITADAEQNGIVLYKYGDLDNNGTLATNDLANINRWFIGVTNSITNDSTGKLFNVAKVSKLVSDSYPDALTMADVLNIKRAMATTGNTSIFDVMK